MPIKLEFSEDVTPIYYDVLCTFTCSLCNGLMTWGVWEWYGICDDCIDEHIEPYFYLQRDGDIYPEGEE